MECGLRAGEAAVMEKRSKLATPESWPLPVRPRDPLIEANGSEYLVTINGSVFLALSLTQAEGIAYRMRRSRHEPRFVPEPSFGSSTFGATSRRSSSACS
jgi:hypothetical protein